MNLEQELRKEIQKNRKRKGGRQQATASLLAHWLKPAQLARARPFPRTHARAVSTRGRPRCAAVASRQSSAAAWRACGSLDVPQSATRSARPRPPPSLLPNAPLCSCSRPLSHSHAGAAAPPRGIAADARSSSLYQLWPPPSSPRPPTAPPLPAAPRAHAQSRSVSLACLVELNGMSRSCGDPSVRTVLPLLYAISCVFRCVNSALALRTHSSRYRALYRCEVAGPRRAAPPRPPFSTARQFRYSVGAKKGMARFVSRPRSRRTSWCRRRPHRRWDSGGSWPRELRVADKQGRLTHRTRLSVALRV